jgi:hypothetical protein
VSDIPPELPEEPTPAPPDQPAEVTEEDVQADALAIAVQAAVAEALAATPRWTKRLGVCSAYSPETQIASIVLDGDTAEVPCLIQTVRPRPGERVIVEIVPGDVGSVAWVVGKVGGTDDPAGVIKWWPGAIPDGGVAGHLECDGSSGHSTAAYPSLAASGMVTLSSDGQTFTVPDLRGRTLFGVADGSGRISTSTPGGTGGSNVISSSALPAHTHSMSGSVSGTTGFDGSHSHGSPGGGFFAEFGGGITVGGGGGSVIVGYSSSTGSGGGHTHSFSGSLSGTSGSTGSGSEHLPPHMAGFWVIKF